MIPLLSKIFSDTESLLEYERKGDSLYVIEYARIYNRLIALARQSDPSMTDSYYDGMGEIGLSRYNSLSDLMCVLPWDWGKGALCRLRECIYVDEQKFEEWASLITSVSPLWLIANFMAGKIDSEILQDKHFLHIFLNKWCQQFHYTALLVPYIPNLEYLIDKEGGLNDLHIHLNGSTEIDILWNHLLNNHNLVYLEYKKVFYANASVRKLSEQIISGFTPEVLKMRLDDARILRERLKDAIDRYYGFDGDLRNSMEGELLLYVMITKLLRFCHDEGLASIFHHYMLIKGLVQRFVVMQHSQVGFSQFQLITNNSFRWNAERFYRNRFLQLSGPWKRCMVNRIEGRFAPKLTVAENKKLVKRIVGGFNEAVKINPETLGDTSLILIAHFIKKPERIKDKEYDIRHYFLRKELKRKAFSLIKMIQNGSNGMGKYVKGVDAAASEFDAGPEVFSPTFRFLRNAGIEHFTYHVGEDFRHLLTGLRVIYEALEFLELKSGDRLGHCTALGIAPELWKKRVGKEVFVRRGEWLDDLVFAWYLIKNYKEKQLQPLILPLESEIQKLSYEVYNMSFLPFELVNAWLLRKNSIIPELNSYCPKGSLDYFDSMHEVEVKKDSQAGKIWQLYNDKLRYKKDGDSRKPYGCRNNYDEIIRVDVDSLINMDSLELIQMMILGELAERNIVIEALPTSNLHISLYNNLKEYHLKRWVESENNECILPSVVLGSDDPGIFMTNIYNEYAMAYLHFGLNKCSITKRMEYVRYMKEYSEIYGFHHG